MAPAAAAVHADILLDADLVLDARVGLMHPDLEAVLRVSNQIVVVAEVPFPVRARFALVGNAGIETLPDPVGMYLHRVRPLSYVNSVPEPSTFQRVVPARTRLHARTASPGDFAVPQHKLRKVSAAHGR